MKVLVFGATGAAGGSVLRICLAADVVSEVRVVARRPPDVASDKLRVFVHQDFLNYGDVLDAFTGVDACLFCLGISVTQVSGEQEYRTITHDFAIAAAHALRARSTAAAFHYLSGRGARADSRFMWARVKAETEQQLILLVDALCWRPGFIDGATSRSSPRLYQATRPLFRLLRPFRSLYVSGDDLGRAMLLATLERLRGRVIENPEIRELAVRARASAR